MIAWCFKCGKERPQIGRCPVCKGMTRTQFRSSNTSAESTPDRQDQDRLLIEVLSSSDEIDLDELSAEFDLDPTEVDMTIVIVDDDPTVRVALKNFLTDSGSSTVAVESAGIALLAPDGYYGNFDIAVIDGLNGRATEVERRILTDKPNCRTICFSGDEKPKGFRGIYVPKPNFLDLTAAIEALTA
ncbi:MAG: hypothetical protein Q8P13_03995 [bacterium]|nr:hypothetical protein [bacterium]